MPRYFFHVHDLIEHRDEEGLECRDHRAAWHQATRACGELLCDIDGAMKPGASVRMQVHDESGRVCWDVVIKTSGVAV